MRAFLRHYGIVIPFALALLACSCGGSTTTLGRSGTTTDGGTSTSGGSTIGNNTSSSSTPALAATPIPAGVTNCAQVAGFGSAGAATAGSGFSDVTFPASSVSYVQQNYADTYQYTTYQFSLINVCANGTTANTVRVL